MSATKRGYFNYLGKQLHLGQQEEEPILDELRTHVEDRAQELIEEGVLPDKALDDALHELGDTATLASQFYEVHSRGSWYHTALAVLPHILLAGMYALHLWTNPVWVVLMFLTALVISFVGWRKGRPRWTYPWLGYCLVAPIVSWGLAMSVVGYGAWSILARGSLPLGIPIYLASFVYIGLSLWVVIRFVSRVSRPDWVMASMGALPIPFLAYWFLYFYSREDLLRSSGQSLQEIDSSAAIVFLLLAAATAIFFRIGRRLVRVALVIITAPSMLILAWLSYQGGPGYVAVFVFGAISMAVLLSPALFDLKGGSDSDPADGTLDQLSRNPEH